MSKIRNLTCIVCPRGCQMKLVLSDDGVLEAVEGNMCRRGAVYATDECTCPKRTVTSTVRCKSGEIVSVKTDKAVPKDMIFNVMEQINSVVADDGVKIGDIIIANVCGTDSNVVATSNAK